MAPVGRLLVGVPLALVGAWMLLIGASTWWTAHRLALVPRGTMHDTYLVVLHIGRWHPSLEPGSGGFVAFCAGAVALGSASIAGAGILVLGGRGSAMSRD